MLCCVGAFAGFTIGGYIGAAAGFGAGLLGDIMIFGTLAKKDHSNPISRLGCCNVLGIFQTKKMKQMEDREKRKGTK